jgi:hypothetical protein
MRMGPRRGVVSDEFAAAPPGAERPAEPAAVVVADVRRDCVDSSNAGLHRAGTHTRRDPPRWIPRRSGLTDTAFRTAGEYDAAAPGCHHKTIDPDPARCYSVGECPALTPALRPFIRSRCPTACAPAPNGARRSVSVVPFGSTISSGPASTGPTQGL